MVNSRYNQNALFFSIPEMGGGGGERGGEKPDRTRTARSGDERTNHEATAPPQWGKGGVNVSFKLTKIVTSGVRFVYYNTYTCM